MLREQKILKEQVTTFISSAENTHLEIGNSRFGIGIIMSIAGFLGVWGCISLLNGIAQTHSIHDLGRAIFTAFTGI
jgi:hypothetical protein